LCFQYFQGHSAVSRYFDRMASVFQVATTWLMRLSSTSRILSRVRLSRNEWTVTTAGCFSSAASAPRTTYLKLHVRIGFLHMR
jgi:hypothetical protein